ncbi:proteasome assembly chaperone family protein [Halegenticoccus tardaugens]|uniref:proteasome assembly chaperone family protein n=1 Tax=Halegenticoccus tardaugens TaxID=2071624 RepID=UPI00100A26EB|nr:PAC2 family protein [Halegenticoccus tardaugens]
MFWTGRRTPEFHVSHEAVPSGTLLAGFSTFGLAGLTAVDYLVDHLDLRETGHITVDELPSITPFEGGKPRHHTRLFSRPDLDVTVLVGELFVPASVGKRFSDAVLDWTEANGVEEVAILSGVPVPHGPEDHRTYYIATDDYRENRLADADVPPMGNGFLDGTNAALVERGLSSPLGVCVYVTPVHAQIPDVDAAIRLLETVESVYGLGIDAAPLEDFAAEVEQYYGELANRMEARETDVPEDRMYM